MSTVTRWLKAAWRWFGPVDWYVAWFGGSAVTSFQLHRPDLGWTYVAIAVALVAGKAVWLLTRPAKKKKARAS